MPIEREFKYVLNESDSLAALLARKATKIACLRQGYLPKAGRLRGVTRLSKKLVAKGPSKHLFTFKHDLATGGVLEFEHAISPQDFDLAWSDCVERLVKRRYYLPFEDHLFEVDELLCGDQPYFYIAECEVAPDAGPPLRLPPILQSHLLLAASLGDDRFGNRRLADVQYALSLRALLRGDTVRPLRRATG